MSNRVSSDKPTQEEWINQHYGIYGGYPKFVELLKAGVTQRAMASHFRITERNMALWVKKYRGLR